MFTLKSATASTNNLAQYNNCECFRCNCTYALSDGVNSMNICNANVRKITTKPLSPQTTSEDFKIYLANIQFLQNASNFLSANYMKNLHHIFKGSYGSYDKSQDANVLTGENNDVKLTNLSIVRLSPNTDRANNSDTDEKQKKMILKIHQEFWDLPTNYQEKPLVFGSQSKNRYKTILPNEHSRVILSTEPDSLAEPYINANYIKVSYSNKKSFAIIQNLAFYRESNCCPGWGNELEGFQFYNRRGNKTLDLREIVYLQGGAGYKIPEQ